MGTVVFGHYFGPFRMDLINRDMLTLAGQLDYTPDAFLVYRVKSRDVNPFFPWDAYCDARLYYTTPLDPAAFTQKLNHAIPNMRDTGIQLKSDTLFKVIDVAVSGSDAKKVPDGVSPSLTIYSWRRTGTNPEEIRLYMTADIEVSLEYKGHQIQGNIVEIYKSGGRFPIWMDCPSTTSELIPLALR